MYNQPSLEKLHAGTDAWNAYVLGERRIEQSWIADLMGADLLELKLEKGDLRGANLEGATLRGANLNEADLRHAVLENAILWGAQLQNTNLEGANLQGADLREADLSGTNFQDADLRGANLRDAKNLQSAMLEGAKLEGALMPFTPDSPADRFIDEEGFCLHMGMEEFADAMATRALPQFESIFAQLEKKFELAERLGKEQVTLELPNGSSVEIALRHMERDPITEKFALLPEVVDIISNALARSQHPPRKTGGRGY